MFWPIVVGLTAAYLLLRKGSGADATKNAPAGRSFSSLSTGMNLKTPPPFTDVPQDFKTEVLTDAIGGQWDYVVAYRYDPNGGQWLYVWRVQSRGYKPTKIFEGYQAGESSARNEAQTRIDIYAEGLAGSSAVNASKK